MLFHTFDYLVFLAVLLAVYWAGSHRFQNLLVLAASYLFYGYVHPWYCLLIGLTTTIDFLAARAIDDHPNRKRLWFGISLATNFSILVALKYFNFFTDNIVAIARLLGFDLSAPGWQVLLPVGISFYTFQSCSYVFDVYRGQLAARRRLTDYALFVSFFPQLVAGPIERAGHLLSQVETPRKFCALDARDGLFLILWGLVKKLVIADTAAVYANKLFSLGDPTFPLVWAGAIAFAVQIYADFSAYSDIACGSALLFGFSLMRNFCHPYTALNPADFWRRWHISLSTWFRDYVYIPLGGNRCSRSHHLFNLFFTFLLSGLWHGAAWNFVFWGAWHGAAMVGWTLLDQRLPAFTRSPRSVVKITQWVITMAIVLFGWLLFREHSIGRTVSALALNPLSAPAADWAISGYLVCLMIVYSLPLILHAALETKLARWQDQRNTWPAVATQSATAILLLTILLTLASSVGSDFIYFQF